MSKQRIKSFDVTDPIQDALDVISINIKNAEEKIQGSIDALLYFTNQIKFTDNQVFQEIKSDPSNINEQKAEEVIRKFKDKLHSMINGLDEIIPSCKAYKNYKIKEIKLKTQKNEEEGVVDIYLNIQAGKYNGKYPYPDKKNYPDREMYLAVKEQYNQSVDEGRELFKKDCLKYFGIENHPKAEKVWEKAWSNGHSGGYYSVYTELSNLIDLIL